MELRRGDVVLAASPGEYGKLRPSVVVQSDALPTEHPSVVVCPLTSDVRELDIRVQVSPDASNGLHARSEVMVDKITVLPKMKLRPVIGRLDAADMAAVDRALVLLLALGEGTGLTAGRSPR